MISGVIFDFNRTLYDPDSGRLTDGAKNLLDFIFDSDCKMCLLSKKTSEDRREKIAELGLSEYFVYVRVLSENKSEVDFEKCLEVMGLYANEVAVIGDRVRSEILLGNRLGMRTIWYRSGKFANETPRNDLEQPNHTILSLEKAKNYLG